MTRARLVITLRLGLLCGAAIWFACTFPSLAVYSLALTVVGLFMPVFSTGSVTCLIVSDAFSTNTIASYTQASGSWSISGGALSTSSSAALITANASGSTGHGVVLVRGQVDTLGGVLGAIGAYVDSNNYLRAELTFNDASSTLKLWQRSGGTETQIGATQNMTLSLNTDYDLRLCWDGTKATCYRTTAGSGSPLDIVIDDACTATGNKAGVYADGATVAVTVFEFNHNQIDNGDCSACDSASCLCTDGTGASLGQAQVVLADIFDGTDGCDELNGTYILEFDRYTDFGAGAGNCRWALLFDTPICGWYGIELLLSNDGHGGLGSAVNLLDSFLSGTMTWGHFGATTPPCDTTEVSSTYPFGSPDGFFNSTATYSFPF